MCGNPADTGNITRCPAVVNKGKQTGVTHPPNMPVEHPVPLENTDEAEHVDRVADVLKEL